MIDLALLREQPKHIRDLLKRKEPSFNIDRLIELDEQVREKRTYVEKLRRERNELAAAAKGGVTEELRGRSRELGSTLAEQEKQLKELEDELNAFWLACPNIPQADIPAGDKEANVAVRSRGEQRVFDFPILNHVQLNEKLHWFDFETAARMSGAQFVLYRGDGVKMLYALVRLMLRNNVKHGFEPLIPPYIVQEHALVNASNLPKFADNVYKLTEDDGYLIPTSESSLTNVHAGQILAGEALPVRYTSWSSCFRREAGGYGAQERGLIRIHQFEKVELYSLCKPDDSDDELERMVTCAEELLTMLGLHYRVSLLAAQDCSFASARTYDIEVWLPGQNRYYEVSSASNCTDFQARRAAIRFRESEGAKPQLVHTLNASSLALPRLMVAIMEQFQRADGSVALPAVLQNEMNAWW